MEELSIEEKAKRYDEAIEIARAINSGKHIEEKTGDTVCECIFPEIKEKGYEEIKKQLIEFLDIFSKCGRNGNYSKWDTSDCANWLIWVEKQNEQKSTCNKFKCPNININNAIEVTSRIKYIDDNLKPIAEFILEYADWDLDKDTWSQPTITVPVFRVLDALINKGKQYSGC